MARPNYGSQAKQRTQRLLEDLLNYANHDWEAEIRSPIRTHWQSDRQLVVRTKLRFLVELTAQDPYPDKLTPEQIREALRRLQDFMGVLEDNRPATQGSEDWHFTLKLWHRRQDLSANLQKFDHEWEQRRSLKLKQVAPSQSTRQDWADAPEITVFYGREHELATLEQWAIADKSHLMTILGMGGVGKTALAIKLAEQIQHHFEVVVWRSLRHAPAIDALLTDLIRSLASPDLPLAATFNGQLLQLLNALQKRRCLLILDNLESVLGRDDRAGELLRCVAEGRHQSCGVVTSREKPQGRLGRSLTLSGLNTTAGAMLLQDFGLATTPTTPTLIARYAGNPLALRIAAPTILELFKGNTERFLDYGAVVFGDIFDLLAQQFQRLSPIEKQVMTALAVHREAVTLNALQPDLLPPVSPATLLDTIDSLYRRSLIEQATDGSDDLGFTQQSVVMEYVTQRLVNQIVDEVMSLNVEQMNHQFLLDAQAKDYIQETQSRLVLQPIAERLIQQLGNREKVRQWLNQYLAQLKSKEQTPGYAAGNLLNLLWSMGVDLSELDFSHLAIWKVYLQGMQLHRVNFRQADLSKSVFTQISGDILSVVFNPEGTGLATGIDRTIVIWQTANSQQCFSLQGHTAWVTALGYSPDGQWLASGSHDHSVRLWNMQTQECHKILQGHTSWVQSIAYHSTGDLLASGGNDKEIRIWHPQTGECVQILQGHNSRIFSLAFQPQSSMLVSSSSDRTVKLWDTKSGQCLHTFEIAVNWSLAMDLHPWGNAIATGNDQTKVQVWELATGKAIGQLPDYQTQVWSVAYSPDGQQLATASEDRTVRLWDVGTGKCLKVFSGHGDRVWLVRFSPDGQTIVSASDDQTIKLWETQTGHCIKTFKTYSHEILSVAASAVGELMASGSTDGIVRLWGTSTRSLTGHTQAVTAIALGNQLLASSSNDRTVRLWDINTGVCLHRLVGHSDWVQTVCLSPDGLKIISGSHDHTLRLWDRETGACLQIFRGHQHRVKAVAFHPSRSLFASGSDDHTIKLWDPQTSRCLETLQGHVDWVLAIAFSPCGSWLASGSGDRTIKLWNVHSRDCSHTLTGHQSRVRSVAFSLDGKWLASGSEDTTIWLWDLETMTSDQILTGHEQIVWSVVWNRSGQLVSGSEDGTIRLWQPETGTCLQVLRSDRPYEDMTIAGVTGLTDTQLTTLKALGARD
jgi:WD40 repeat protein